MKKFISVFIAFSVIFSSVGTSLLFMEDSSVEAKSYKSGKKTFNTNQNNFQNKTTTDKATKNDSTSTNKNSTSATNNTKKGGFLSGGLMKGLFIGGLAGLLFGSLFGDMGMLGSLLGLIINAFAIIVIVLLCVKIVQFFKRKKDKDEDNRRWNN